MTKRSMDEKWMGRAIELAKRGIGTTSPNPRVGAVVVSGGRVVGEGFHAKAGEAHAEVLALRRAGHRARGAVLYVSMEPCSTYGKTPPCTDAILASGVARVVFGSTDPNRANRSKAVRVLKAKRVKVEGGVLHAACDALNRPFESWMIRRRPWVTLKLASSLDGRIATRTGDSHWITSPAARALVQNLRYSADAILVGANTVRRDNPRLDVRGTRRKEILKVVLSSKESIPSRARIYESGDPVWIMSAKGRAGLLQLLQKLGQHGALHLLVEGGGETAASFLEAGLVDEVFWFVAPKIIGGRSAVASVGGTGIKKLADAMHLHQTSVRTVGPDILVHGFVDARGRVTGPFEKNKAARLRVRLPAKR